MNRKKAIKLIKEFALRVKPLYEPQRTEYTKAIEMAIEALSPRRREDATEEDYAYCNDCEAVEMCMWYPYDGCIFKIQSRQKGEWIGEGDGYADGEMIYDTWYCSECDHCEESEELALPNFCPNCGADMRSEKEYLDKTFPEHNGGEWFDITDMMTKEGKE